MNEPDTLTVSRRRRLGRVALEPTVFGLGTAPIGNLFTAVSDADAQAMIDAAWDAGVRCFDTAPMYGHGLAELRTGQGLRARPRDEFVLSSKVGRVLTPAPRTAIDFGPWVQAAPFAMRFDYSYDGTMRSIEHSLQRLGLERIDICLIHDIDRVTHGANQPAVFEQAMDGCLRALESLRAQRVVKAIGVGVNEWQVCHEALQRHDFDCFLLAGRYTLLEQDALDAFLPLCERRDVAVMVGGGFNSGILATGARPGAKFNYAPASPEILDKVGRIEAICAQWSVPLPAAALQFVVAHPAVASFIAGVRNVVQLEQNLRWFEHAIPSGFWAELKRQGLLREEAPVPAART